MTPTISRCAICGREIFSVRTRRGVLVVDAKPVLGGTVVIDYRHNTGESVAHVVKSDPTELGYVQHFETCTQPTLFEAV